VIKLLKMKPKKTVCLKVNATYIFLKKVRT
jgi:hypothetical protein